jgi:deoxyribodipyrimidine photo-lyase
MNKNLLIWDTYQQKIIEKYKTKHIICKEDYTLDIQANTYNKSGKAYKVFTPFYNMYKNQITYTPINLVEKTSSQFRKKAIEILQTSFTNYSKTRNYPYISNGTTQIGKYLNYGVISIREAAFAFKGNPELLKQLIWKDFYYFSYEHQLKVLSKSDTIKKRINWSNANNFIKAGVHELTTTGWVNNRLRMIISMFLIKYHGVDPSSVETWFSKYMIDYYKSSNIGGISWTISQPNFKIFNFDLQMKKYDSKGTYVHNIYHTRS